MVNINVRVNMDTTQRILTRLMLNHNGKAQVFFTKECAKYFDNYVPFDTGRLKNMNCSIYADKIVYDTPYATKQYYTNTGQGKRNNTGLRGSYWDRRCWASRGNEIIRNTAKFIGGRVR